MKKKIITGAIVSILCLELFCRLFISEYHMLLPNYHIDSMTNYTYLPNTTAIHPQNGIKFIFNKDGYLGKDFSLKSPHVYRIALVGDSFISGAYYTPYYTNVCEELQNEFNKKGYRVEILNCGIDGAKRSYSNFLSIKKRVVNLNPDMIIFSGEFPLFDENIVKEYYKNYRIDYPRFKDSIYFELKGRIDKYHKYESVFNTCYKTSIGKGIMKIMMKCSPKGSIMRDFSILCMKKHIFRQDTTIAQKFSISETIQMYQSLHNWLNQKGISFFLLNILKDRAPQIVQICKQNNIPLINLNIELTDKNDLFPNDHHPTKQGNQKIAKKLFNIIDKNELINSKYINDLELIYSKPHGSI